MDALMKTLLDDAKRKKGHEEYEPTHLVFAWSQGPKDQYRQDIKKVLHLAYALMEYFLERNALLRLW